MLVKPSSIFFLLSLLCISSCQYIPELLDEVRPGTPQVQQFASGLRAPLGLEVDQKGQLWVTEAGTGMADDGTLSLITPQGVVHRIVEGFPSEVSP